MRRSVPPQRKRSVSAPVASRRKLVFAAIPLTVPPTNCALTPGSTAANGSIGMRHPSATQNLQNTADNDNNTVTTIDNQLIIWGFYLISYQGFLILFGQAVWLS